MAALLLLQLQELVDQVQLGRLVQMADSRGYGRCLIVVVPERGRYSLHLGEGIAWMARFEISGRRRGRVRRQVRVRLPMHARHTSGLG